MICAEFVILVLDIGFSICMSFVHLIIYQCNFDDFF